MGALLQCCLNSEVIVNSFVGQQRQHLACSDSHACRCPSDPWLEHPLQHILEANNEENKMKHNTFGYVDCIVKQEHLLNSSESPGHELQAQRRRH